MGVEQKILVMGKSPSAAVASVLCVCAVLVAACGQKGNLYLPNDPEFQQRAKLPDIVRRQLPGSAVVPSASPASTPASAISPATPAPAAVGR